MGTRYAEWPKTSCLLAASASNNALKLWPDYGSRIYKDKSAACLLYVILLGRASEEPGSILRAVSSMRFLRKSDRLSEMVALLENSKRQREKRPRAVKAYVLESACNRGAAIVMHCFSKVLGRVHQARRRPAVKLNTCTLRKGCLQIVWHFSLRGT